MKYIYYPGCSLENTAPAYHKSTLAVAHTLGIEFQELDDWNCCGATEFVTVDLMQSYALVGRNLALAQRQSGNGHARIVAPCSACFLNLSKGDQYLVDSPTLADKVNQALEAGGLHYTPGSVKTSHLLHVVMDEVGLETIEEQIVRPLYGLRVAPYYGCLIVRPGFEKKFDDYEYPTSLDKLMKTIGTEVVDFPLKAHCCGGHMTQISEDTAYELIRRILHNAAEYEADVIATICPMCQLNLEAYQGAVNKRFGTEYDIPVLYFTQLLGLAFGYSNEDVGIGRELVNATPALEKILNQAPEKPKPKRRPKEALPMPGEE